MSVAHLNLNDFFVSVERLKDSRLQRYPIIIGSMGERSMVAACSSEARHMGICPTMAMKVARRLCPQAVVIAGDYEAYEQSSRLVTEVIDDQAPLFEKASLNRFYLNLEGMDRFFGCWKWTNELRQRIIKESGLPLSFGLSVNKTVARVANAQASLKKGSMQVMAPQVSAFLAPLPVYQLPEVSPTTSQSLAQMGVRSIRGLRQIPKGILSHVYGKEGPLLWQRSRGIDRRPIVPYRDQKSVSQEHVFPQDTISLQDLKTALTQLTEQLGFQLRKHQKLCTKISLKLRYTNFDTVKRQLSLPYTANDESLLKVAFTLLEGLYTRRLRVRLIGLSLSGLVAGSHQIRLFEDTTQKVALYEAVDELKGRHGAGIIGRAVGKTGKSQITKTNRAQGVQQVAD